MALSGPILQAALEADILSQLQTKFPINSGLLTAEKAGLQTALQSLANAIADATGPDVVTHITTNAVVAVTSVSGVTTGPGVSGPGVGTVT